MKKRKIMQDELRLSVSKCKTFNQCKKQYEFNYILKFPQKERDYLTTGKFCHMVLEFFHKQYIDGCLLPYNIAMTDAFKLAKEEYKDNMTKEMIKECWNIIDQYLQIISKNKIMPNVLSVERRFEFPIKNNIILTGAIDKVVLDDDNICHVHDYKTTKNKKYLQNDWFQLLTYAYILLQEDPSIKKVRGSYILLRHNFEAITKEFDIKEIKTVAKKFEKYAEDIRKETEFTPNPSPLCEYCSFLDHCPEGKSKVSCKQDVYGEVAW
jgi:RecB family exonuclease